MQGNSDLLQACIGQHLQKIYLIERITQLVIIIEIPSYNKQHMIG